MPSPAILLGGVLEPETYVIADLELAWAVSVLDLVSVDLELAWAVSVLDLVSVDLELAWAIDDSVMAEIQIGWRVGTSSELIHEGVTPARSPSDHLYDDNQLQGCIPYISTVTLDPDGATPNAPVAALPEADGFLSLGHVGDYYYRIWVIPRFMHLSNPRIGSPVPFLVWNAYPYDLELEEIVETGSSGVVLDITAPSTFTEIEIRTVELTITAAAGITVSVDWLFDFALGEGLFQFRADIANYVAAIPDPPITEYWEWKTDVMTAHDSTEQRVALRGAPRRFLEYSLKLLDETDRREYYRSWYRSLPSRVVLPYYQYGTLLEGDSPAGGSTLHFTTARTDVRAGEFILVLDSSTEEGQLLKVETVAADNVTLESPVQTDLLKGFVVAPAFTSLLANHTGPSMLSITGELAVRSQVLETRSQFTRPGATVSLTEFGGVPVLDRRPLAQQFVPESFDAGYEILDSETGVLEIKTGWDHPFVGGVRQFLVHRFSHPEEMDWWRAFLDYCRGQQNPFLIPTYREDLLPAENPSPGSAQLMIAFDEYVMAYFPHQTYRYLWVETVSGVQTFEVLQATENGDGTQTLELAQSWGLDPDDVAILRISWLNLARLSDDRVKLVHDQMVTIMELQMRTINA